VLHTFFIRPILPIGVCSTSTKEIREQRETIGGTAHTCILFPVFGFLEMLRPFTSRSRTESANFRRFISATVSAYQIFWPELLKGRPGSVATFGIAIPPRAALSPSGHSA